MNLTAPISVPFPNARRTAGRFIKHYLYGCFAKAWNGAWAAVYGFLGLAAGSSLDPEHVKAPDWHALFYCFAVAWGIGVIGYFKDNPLPEKLDTQPPFQPTNTP